jgi:hypothetical protein
VEAIAMSGWRVIVTEQRSRDLAGRDAVAYISPPQTEQQARSLIALLAGAGRDHDGTGRWRRPVAGGQRTIELRAVE